MPFTTFTMSYHTPIMSDLLQRNWIEFEIAENDLKNACQTADFTAHKGRAENYVDGIPQCHTYVCYKGGAENKKLKKEQAASGKMRTRTSAKTGCKWEMKLVKSATDDIWRVSRS